MQELDYLEDDAWGTVFRDVVLRQILKTVVRLEYRHQEETAFRFRLTRDGDLVAGSVNTLRRSLITGGGR